MCVTGACIVWRERSVSVHSDGIENSGECLGRGCRARSSDFRSFGWESFIERLIRTTNCCCSWPLGQEPRYNRRLTRVEISRRVQLAALRPHPRRSGRRNVLTFLSLFLFLRCSYIIQLISRSRGSSPGSRVAFTRPNLSVLLRE